MLSKYSYSSLETYRQCPKKFWFQKIERPAVRRKLMVYNHLGNAVHNQLKIAYQRALELKPYSLEEMLAGFEAAWAGEVREKIVLASEHQTIDDEIEAGRRMLRMYHRRYQPFDQGQLKLAEQMLNFELPDCRSTFTAKPDRVWQRDDGVVEICDYKTGKQMVAGASDDGFRRQMGLYQLAVQSAFPQFEQIELAQYFLRHDEVVRGRLRADEVDELAETFRTEVSQIAYADRLNDWPTKESGLCSFCDYAHLCPAQRHRTALDEEVGSAEQATAEQAADLADRFLECHQQKRAFEAELKALREDLLVTAKALGYSRLTGQTGSVQVSIKNVEKLPTKTSDPDALAALSAMVRGWGEDMELCFKLDDRALLALVKAGRLSPERLEQLKPFLSVEESTTVRANPKPNPNESD